MKYLVYISLIASLFLASCGNLQQDIEIDIPEYDPQLVVECYLQPGLPYFLTLTRSQPYFDDIRVDYIEDAIVTISHSGGTDTLDEFNLDITDPTLGLLADTAILNTFSSIFGDQLTFYASLRPVPELFNEDFNLEIKTLDGEVLTAKTQILNPVPIDSLVQELDEDSLAFILTYFTDEGDRTNYYRRVFEAQRPVIDSTGTEPDTTFEFRIIQDFVVDDDIFDGQPFAFGTDFEFAIGDTIRSTLYHMTQDHFEFYNTQAAAVQASLSPFGQPAVVHTNISGGRGIFTGLVFSQETYVIQPE
ncbi:MAG: DUF4249 domain-containing protein [Bacteroidia bacterium]|nr:DUF4249 domain-containing protein [Bacteroidia bacterium]